MNSRPFNMSPLVHRRGCCGGAFSQAGVGLIEVLVAVLILSIAFLGIAALQAMSLSSNNGAMMRSMATISTYSILDAMRADRANVVAGSYNTTAVVANACPAGTGSLAAYQLNQWCGQLGQNLGAVGTTKGAISCTAGTSDCTITVTFEEVRKGTNNSTTQQVVTRAML